eukprot:Gb_01734 [translate_table: standard]
MDPTYSLPNNIAIITLEELKDGSVLLRLAHLYEVGEDAEFSNAATVELIKVFANRTIRKITEMSLSANQEKSAMKVKRWRVEGYEDGKQEKVGVRGGPINEDTLVVELGPMEIRTFILFFK